MIPPIAPPLRPPDLAPACDDAMGLAGFVELPPPVFESVPEVAPPLVTESDPEPPGINTPGEPDG